MIPTLNRDDLQIDFEFEEQPSLTYKINRNESTIIGFVDELEAVVQAIYLILNIERYDYFIYSWDYGIELNDLYGEPVPFVLPELKRRISEALMQDTRIIGVDNFTFETNKNSINARFTVSTIFGDVEAERAVII